MPIVRGLHLPENGIGRVRAGSQDELELLDGVFIKAQAGMYDHPSKLLFHPH
jgi:hypothetical protein